jgi:hypothetical protein
LRLRRIGTYTSGPASSTISSALKTSGPCWCENITRGCGENWQRRKERGGRGTKHWRPPNRRHDGAPLGDGAEFTNRIEGRSLRLTIELDASLAVASAPENIVPYIASWLRLAARSCGYFTDDQAKHSFPRVEAQLEVVVGKGVLDREEIRERVERLKVEMAVQWKRPPRSRAQ